MKFRKKPVVIEARQLTRIGLIYDAIANWSGAIKDDDGLIINTLEGQVFANFGDWIIRGVKGEFYPCKPDIFKATYEEVE